MGTPGEPPPAWFVPTSPPAVGSAFSLWYEYESVPIVGVTALPFVTYTIGGFTGVSPCNGCFAAALSPLSAAQLSLYGSPITNAQGVHLNATLPLVILNPGWQSGSFTSFIETVVETGYVSGKVTSVSSIVRTVSVPEPSTWLLGMIGAFLSALIVRSRPLGGVR